MNPSGNSADKNTEDIVLALRKKSKKLSTYNKKALIKQALYFSPFYRDFIALVLNNSFLKIEACYHDGSCQPYVSNDDSPTLRKREKTKIYVDLNIIDILPHELGHAIDFFFGYDKALSKVVVLSSNKTLEETFIEEFSSKKEEIYKEVMNEYRKVMDNSIGKGAYDTIISNLPLYAKLKSIPSKSSDLEALKQRKYFQRYLYESNFVETYYKLFEKGSFRLINKKYSPILDALSSSYDFSHLFLEHHDISYYEANSSLAPLEFFANLFEIKVTNKRVQSDSLIELMPKSYEAFEELFYLFYNRLLKKKTFSDLRIKKGE